MFRRKTKNFTAYTGVGLASPTAQQPNNNAMAAALTIGQNLKEAHPEVYTQPRAASLKKPTIQKAPSLLKRSPLIQHHLPSTSTPRASRAGSNASHRHSIASSLYREYHVDDSFNDTFLEEMGREADTHYSNVARVKDLKLTHKPQQAQPAPAKPKMVKKYIPTPNGIKVVEVPEDSMKQEIARSNSMRSNIARSPSTRRMPRAMSLTQPKQPLLPRVAAPPRLNLLGRGPVSPKQGSSRVSSRLSSLASASHMSLVGVSHIPESEAEAEETLNDASLYKSNELRNLQREIEREKELALELETKRLEYEKLRELRLSNERSMRELEKLEHTISPVSEEEDVPIRPVPIAVDELKMKQLEDKRANGQLPVAISGSEFISTSPHDRVVDSFADVFVGIDDSGLLPNPDLSTDQIVPHSLEGASMANHVRASMEQNLKATGNSSSDFLSPKADSISAQLGDAPSPRFDPVPELINTYHDDDVDKLDLLSPPAASIRSLSSLDSKSKPMKSAMKTSKTVYVSKGDKSVNPAQQAYLSLTTAENTRLNSKLSSSQLTTGQEPDAQPPRSPNTQQRRMSQSLRKQPSGNSQNGLSGRSLRPQSYVETPTNRASGGMSSRSFKTQPAPFPSHPAAQANYKSPSKVRAAELYAKANKRPVSQFQSIQRKSSFSRDEKEARPPQRETRTSMRNSVSLDPRTNNEPAHASAISTTKINTATSRFANSDDEGDLPSSGGHHAPLVSRFVDSDDDLPQHSTPQTLPSNVASSPIKSLRNKGEATKSKDEEKAKKPKKKFLKKLFGRN